MSFVDEHRGPLLGWWRGLAARWRSVPVVDQTELSDCGAACLEMVFRFHGRFSALAQTRALVASHGRSVGARALLEAARACGMNARAFSLAEPGAARALPRAAILHWRGRHFVVLDRMGPSNATIVDPACGRRTMSYPEFSRGFAGVALVFRPTPQFRTSRPVPNAMAHALAQFAGKHRGLVAGFVGAVLASPMMFGVVAAWLVAGEGARLEASPWRLLGVGLAAIGIRMAMYLVRARCASELLLAVEAFAVEHLVHRLFALPGDSFERRTRASVTALVGDPMLRTVVSSGVVQLLLDAMSVGSLWALAAIVEWPVAAAGIAGSLVQIWFATTWGTPRPRYREIVAQAASARALREVADCAGDGGRWAMVGAFERWRAAFAQQRAATRERALVGGRFEAVVDALGYVGIPIGAALSISQGDASGVAVASMLMLVSAHWLRPALTIGIQLAQLRRPVGQLRDFWTESNGAELSSPDPEKPFDVLRLERVCVSYRDARQPSLQDVSLELGRGELIAIVGEGGSGKSTLAKVIAGVKRPTAGRVCRMIGERLVVGSPAAMVTSSSTRFGAGSVFDNIAGSGDADDEGVKRAAEVTQVHDELLQLPLGYDTPIGDRGAVLSDSQRARVLVARSLRAARELLVLDNILEAVDAACLRRLVAALRQERLTLVVVSQRRPVLEAADQVVVLQGAKVASVGTHEQLSVTCPIYCGLLELQSTSQGQQGRDHVC